MWLFWSTFTTALWCSDTLCPAVLLVSPTCTAEQSLQLIVYTIFFFCCHRANAKARIPSLSYVDFFISIVYRKQTIKFPPRMMKHLGYKKLQHVALLLRIWRCWLINIRHDRLLSNVFIQNFSIQYI